MLVLAIDTATPCVSIALGDDERVVAAMQLASGTDRGQGVRRHAELLAPGIESMCAQAGVRVAEVTAVAVGIGPGMFTGLRVGVTTAKVLAQTLRVPIVPVVSLDLVAYPLRFTTPRRRLGVGRAAARGVREPVRAGARRVATGVRVRGAPTRRADRRARRRR